VTPMLHSWPTSFTSLCFGRESKVNVVTKWACPPHTTSLISHGIDNGHGMGLKHMHDFFNQRDRAEKVK